VGTKPDVKIDALTLLVASVIVLLVSVCVSLVPTTLPVVPCAAVSAVWADRALLVDVIDVDKPAAWSDKAMKLLFKAKPALPVGVGEMI
jgi:hypothetical protein